MGNGSTTNQLTPVDVVGLTSGVARISTGSYHTCAVIHSGGIKCWGSNAYGQLGTGNLYNSAEPVAVVGLTAGVASVSTGSNHTCALTTAGGVKCWGYNYHGQLGNNSTTNAAIPTDVVGMASGVTQVEASGEHTCAITTSGAVRCWGYGNSGRLGTGTTNNQWLPADVRF